MFDLLTDLVPFYLWRYNGAVEIVNYREHQFNQLGGSGICPHCTTQSYFHPAATHIESNGNMNQQRGVSAAKCQSCKKFILIVGFRVQSGHPFELTAVYPLGKPNDTISPEVVEAAKAVAEDFAEALRCHWIKSYRGSVVMCRRAIQSSAIALEAEGGRLIDQIDNLFETGKITEALKDFAHEVRLTGNDGAHPDKDGLADVKEKDSSDIIEFTKEYLHHVYVMPAKLKARKTPPPTARGTT